ncbi:MAG: lysophospholipase [Methylotenera sp.]|nr:lysophospholipase [Oligoflexia bacterium]
MTGTQVSELKTAHATGSREPAGILQPAGFPGLPAGWTTKWETFPDSDGTCTLFATQYQREDLKSLKSVRALIVLHGLGEHGGRYMHLPHYLKDTVDLIYCHDHRGHGRSQGPRGHIERFDAFAEDAGAVIRRLSDQLAREHAKSEVHLLGHSMGGLIALRVGILSPELPIASLIVTAPLLAVKAQVPALKKAAAALLTHVWGSLALDTGFDPSVLSRDKNVVDAYVSDRLVHGKMTSVFYSQMNAAMAATLAAVTSGNCEIKPPIEILVPLDDGLVDADKALFFSEGLKHTDKRLKVYEGFKHEIMNELGKEQVFEDIAEWITSHSALKPQVPSSTSGRS